MDSKWLKNGFVYLVITVAILAIIFTLFVPPARENSKVSLTEFIAIVQDAAWTSSERPRVIIADNRLIAEIDDKRITTSRRNGLIFLRRCIVAALATIKWMCPSKSPASSATFSPLSAPSSQFSYLAVSCCS